MIRYAEFRPQSERAEAHVLRLEAVVDDFVSRLGNLGAIISIRMPGRAEITITKGHSDITKMREVQPDDIFQIGSQSKTTIAVTVLLLERDGLLKLDDPVHNYVDLPIDKRITIRNLLMNSSGMGEYTIAGGPVFDMRLKFLPRDLVALALPQGQLFEPGTRFDYCNTGWVVATMVIEAVTGRPYGDVCAARVVAPLGLANTAFGTQIPEGNPMRGYAVIPPATEPTDMTEHLSWVQGAGDGVSNVSDILDFYMSLLDQSSALGVSLHELSANTLEPTSKPYFPMSLGAAYGLGLERRAWAGREVWGHPGSTGSCRTSTWIDPGKGVGVATAVTQVWDPSGPPEELRYPREQLFAMALEAAYAVAPD